MLLQSSLLIWLVVSLCQGTGMRMGKKHCLSAQLLTSLDVSGVAVQQSRGWFMLAQTVRGGGLFIKHLLCLPPSGLDVSVHWLLHGMTRGSSQGSRAMQATMEQVGPKYYTNLQRTYSCTDGLSLLLLCSWYSCLLCHHHPSTVRRLHSMTQQVV